MSRSYSTFRKLQPFTDGKEANHSAMAPSDHVHRPFILDTEGKQRPIIRYASSSNGQKTYVIEAEIVEHSIAPAPDFAPKYRYSWQPREEFSDIRVENRHRYHYPDQQIEEFINKIQDEVSRRATAPVAPHLINSWGTGPNGIVPDNNRKYDDERKGWKDDHKKLNGSPNRDRHSEPYLRRDDHKKLNDSPNRDRHNEPYLRRDDHKKLNDSPNRDRHNQPYLRRDDHKKLDDSPNRDRQPYLRRDDHKKLDDSPTWDRQPYLRRDDHKKLDDSPNRDRQPYLRRDDHKKLDDSPNRDRQPYLRRDDHKKQNDSPNRDRHNEPYRSNKGTNTRPMICNGDVCEFYERPPGYEGHDARSHPLSKPTNEINTAMEFLKESINRSYGNGKETEKESNNTAYSEASRPPKTFPLATTRWRTGTNMSGPNTKVEPKDYDSEEEEKESRNPLGKFDELKINNRGGEKMFNKKDGYENPKRNSAAATQFGQTAGKKKTTPETIDSREASRLYGKLPSRPMEREDYEGTITSKEAVAKYKGALVPR